MTVTRRPLIAGNWKMNGLRADGLALAGALAERMRSAGDAGFDMLVCPPFTLLAEIGLAIDGSGIALGAQDCHEEQQGAHTGDVSAIPNGGARTLTPMPSSRTRRAPPTSTDWSRSCVSARPRTNATPARRYRW